MNPYSRQFWFNLVFYSFLFLFAGCASNQQTTNPNNSTTPTTSANNQSLQGEINIDGSSTVYPITQAMAEEFQTTNPDVKITVGVSGTGGGFKKFCAGETDISDASRPIKQSEIDACQQAGIEYVEIPVAFDALSVVVHPDNSWASCLTTEELKKIWSPESQGKINNWQQIRADFPNQPLTLYAPGTDSGTFDYFTDAINGEEGASRGDYTASEDDNIIIQGVANDTGGLGYFGLAYLEENLDKLKPVSINDQDSSNGEGCIEPNRLHVEEGTYQPLARPIFIYVSKSAIDRPEIKAFVNFYLQKDHSNLVSEVGYVPMPELIYDKAQERFETQKTGTVFAGSSGVGVKLKDVL